MQLNNVWLLRKSFLETVQAGICGVAPSGMIARPRSLRLPKAFIANVTQDHCEKGLG